MSIATILIVEDEPLILTMMEDVFQENGFDVIAATRGDEAIEILDRQIIIDVLFTDIRMPGLVDGWQLGEHAGIIRPEIGIFYATGFTQEMRPNIDPARFFRKPYSLTDVVQAVRSSLPNP